MPPRRSVGRNVASTPARSTRAKSAVPVDDSNARQASKNVPATSPNPKTSKSSMLMPEGALRDLQLQQSYGYGSKASFRDVSELDMHKLLPRDKAAAEIDIGIAQAKDRFESQGGQVNGELESSPPASRTRKKTSRERSREPSAELQETSSRKAKVEAWTKTLASDQLEEIAEEREEDDENDEEDRTRRGSEPSSFPSGIFDASYNFERGARKPRTGDIESSTEPSSYQKALNAVQEALETVRQSLKQTYRAMLDLLSRTLRAISKSILDIPESPAFGIGVKAIFLASCVAVAGVAFCFFFSRFLCDPESQSIVSQNLQMLCGSCTRSPAISPLNISGLQQGDASKLASGLQSIQKQIHLLENRLNHKFDSQHSALRAEVEVLRDQQTELRHHLDDLQASQPRTTSSDGVASPLLPKVNFFAPSNGAIVQSSKSSPTKAKPNWLPVRVAMRAVGIRQTISKDHSTALQPWHDVGDCWCAAAPDEGDFVRLHVAVREDIYPTEFIIEHFPPSGTLEPGTAPKDIEVWADFSSMATDKQERLGIGATQDGNVLGPNFARVGAMQYDISNRVNHVQTFRLDVNQQGLFHYAKEFVVRVISNYGADHACLYRLRLHGVPVDAPVAPEDGHDDWFKQQGYVMGET